MNKSEYEKYTISTNIRVSLYLGNDTT